MRDLSLARNGFHPRMSRLRAIAPAGYEGAFGVDDLSALRRLAAAHGRQAGLGPGRLSDFVLAVDEIASQALSHGCESVRLWLWTTGDDLRCEVRGGSWISAQQRLAAPDDTDSLRLWVVWQVCSEVNISYGPDETTVVLSMRIH